jgi:hypothetical protein
MMPLEAVDRMRVKGGGAVSYSAMSAQVALMKFDSKQSGDDCSSLRVGPIGILYTLCLCSGRGIGCRKL